ncbi:hypothetical protein [Streptomyces achromogenes]|uniref:hypothetical protein n=1 Tax=Streptomyces achromogenes TaxID=67255 RepID=UPI00342CE593
MSVHYRRLMEEEARKEAAERERLAAEEETPAAVSEAEDSTSTAVPAPAGEADPLPPTAPAEPYRPQPFTPDLLPEPREIAAEGELTPQEIDELGHCEAAYGNANKAEWMKWKAAHAVRSRRLYRRGGRTWPEYCEYWFGESESEVNRRIQQWPLLKRITELQDRPRLIPDSHVQRLLPLVKTHGEELAALAYVEMRKWGADRKIRITAELVGSVVELAKNAEARTLATGNLFQQAIEATPRQRSKQAKKHVVAVPETTPADEEAEGESTGAEGSVDEGAGPDGADGHPNLGDPAPPAGAETGDSEKQQEPEGEAAVADPREDRPQGEPADPLTGRLSLAASQLQGMSEGFLEPGLLQRASTDTLKTIVEAARRLAEAAEAELASR